MQKKKIVVFYVEEHLTRSSKKIAKAEKNQQTKENKLKPLNSLNV
jgi:hypothetical protein